MKVTSLVFATLLIVTACGDSKEKKENTVLKQEIEKLKTENTSLKSGEVKMKASIDEFNKFLKEIEQNLASVDQNKAMLAELNSEKKDQKNFKADIKNHISRIKELMENSKLKVIALDKTLVKLRKESGDKSTEILALDKQIKSLTRSLFAKEEEIEILDNELLNAETLYELELINSSELRSIINRAYFIASSAKELKAQGIINKEGGFIGLGKVKVMNANASDTLFNKIKKDETAHILLNAKKAKLISNHPSASYEIKGENGKADKLVIKDKELFWKEGNYLVIEIDN